jgi:hypothetical protein
VHLAPTYAGFDHLGSYVRRLSLHFCKRMFPGLEPMTPWSQSQDNSFTVVPGLPFNSQYLFMWADGRNAGDGR